MGDIRALARKPPKFVYKYRPLANCRDWDRLLRIIETSKLYHPSPTKFNDPFDCKVGALGSVQPSFVRYLIAARRATPATHYDIWAKFCAPRIRLPEELQRVNAPLNEEEMSEIIRVLKSIQENVNASTVLCLCAVCNNILMWSHYADSHRGVCLKFSLTNWPEMRSGLLPVVYSTRQIPINLTKSDFDNAGLVRAVNLSKHRGWSYEKEWRALGMKSGEYDFPSAALVGIIFGCRTSSSDKLRVKNAIVENGRHIKFYEARERKGEFALDICAADFI